MELGSWDGSSALFQIHMEGLGLSPPMGLSHGVGVSPREWASSSLRPQAGPAEGLGCEPETWAISGAGARSPLVLKGRTRGAHGSTHSSLHLFTQQTLTAYLLCAGTAGPFP